MEPNTGCILCGAQAQRKKKGRGPLWSGSGLWRGWLCQQKWWDLIIPIAYELSEPPQKPVEGLQSQQLSHNPLSGSEYQTFVGHDLISCVLLVWISPIDQIHKSILVKLRSSCRRTLQCGRKKHTKMWSRKLISGQDPTTRSVTAVQRGGFFVLDVYTYYIHDFWRSRTFLWWKLRFCSTVLKFCKAFIRCTLWGRTSLSIRWPAEIKSHFTNRHKKLLFHSPYSESTPWSELCACQITGEVNGTKKKVFSE